jgi:hypothetical protein
VVLFCFRVDVTYDSIHQHLSVACMSGMFHNLFLGLIPQEMGPLPRKHNGQWDLGCVVSRAANMSQLLLAMPSNPTMRPLVSELNCADLVVTYRSCDSVRHASSMDKRSVFTWHDATLIVAAVHGKMQSFERNELLLG